MFIHKTQLRHLLRPEHYASDAQYRRERDRLFRPTWHLVATTHELPNPGDYVAFDLLGEPVLLRNMDGALRAFLNVCPHRHSRLVREGRGSSERLRCQYHGWEYDAEGRTGKIPDAPCFRPFDRENACLRPFRVATCGALVFVSLAPEGPSLEDHLGPLHETWRASFDAPFRLAGSWDEDFACNWKVAVENALEDYHIPLVHPKTFGTYADEEQCEHVLDERYTTYTRSIKSEDNRFGRAANRLIRWLGGSPQGLYRHQIIHPNLMFSGLDVSRTAIVVYPTSPTSCRFRMYCFTLRGERKGPGARMLGGTLRKLAVMAGKRVFREDGGIYEEIQRGLASSPFPGVIGTREERVYAFQHFVLRGCGGPDAPAEGLPVQGADSEGRGEPVARHG